MAEQLAVVEKEACYVVAGEEIKLSLSTVKNYLTRGNGKVSDQEVVMFINLCKYQKLNPFLNEAYLVKFGDQPAQNIIGKEAFMKRAEDSEQYDGFRAGIIVERNGEVIELEGCFSLKTDTLLGGWCEVYRKDRKYPVRQAVSLDEYNKNQSTWNSMAKTMIRKVAIVQALREAFPQRLSGLYTEDEFNGSSEHSVEYKIKANANKEEFIIDTQGDFFDVAQDQQEQITLDNQQKPNSNSKVPF